MKKCFHVAGWLGSLLACGAPLPGTADHFDLFLREAALAELEERVEAIDANLNVLSHFTLRGGVGAIGYRFPYRARAETTEVIGIAWDKPELIDEIILVPVIRRAQVNHYEADAFPIAFSVFCGTSDPGNEIRLATFTEADGLLPRIAPLVIPCNGIQASWVRIETARLSKSAFDERCIFQLAEIMAFSGDRNVALQGTVQVKGENTGGQAWKSGNLVDGFVPYLMDAAGDETSPAVVSGIGEGDPATLTIDLEAVYPVDRIHLHAALVGDTLPYMFDSHFGIPNQLRIEGALEPDFADKVTLLNLKSPSEFDTGPIIMRNLAPQACRYVRLVAKEPHYLGKRAEQTRFGFAEVELFSGNTNVALGKPASANFNLGYFATNTVPLTDGQNLYGKIMPVRTWLNELALRHELEKERPRVAAELNRRYARQKWQVAWLVRLASGLGISIVFGMLLEWVFRQRAIHRTRERIAADIHDELGANLHAIGLLGNLARTLKNAPDEQEDVLIHLQEMARRTGLAARHCTNMLEADELHEDLVDDLRRTTERLAADLEHNITFEGEPLLHRLKPAKRVDLMLFYKECLINVIRHSGATRVVSRVAMTPQQLTLSVADNGCGTQRTVPSSTRRRARLLGGRAVATTPAEGGTLIQLTLPIHRWNLSKWSAS